MKNNNNVARLWANNTIAGETLPEQKAAVGALVLIEGQLCVYVCMYSHSKAFQLTWLSLTCSSV
jgi:hypothetical protein